MNNEHGNGIGLGRLRGCFWAVWLGLVILLAILIKLDDWSILQAQSAVVLLFYLLLTLFLGGLFAELIWQRLHGKK